MAEKTLSIKLVVSGNGELKIKQFADGVAVSRKAAGDLDAQLKSLNGTVKMSANEWNALTRELQAQKNAVVEGSEAYRILDRQIKQVQNTRLNSLNKSMTGVSSATGAASASVLELGRIVSDSPYGIRGIANNVSQLATQVAFMSTSMVSGTGKALGFAGALRAVGSAMLGPLGILVAFQAVVAGIEMYSNRTDEATQATKDLNTEMENQLDLIQRLNFALGNEDGLSFGFLTTAEAVAVLRNQYSEFKGKFDEQDESFKNSTERVRGMVSQYTALLNARRQDSDEMAEINRIREEGTDAEKASLVLLQQQNTETKLAIAQLAALFEVEKKGRGSTSNAVLSIASYRSNAKDYEKEIIATQARIAKIENLGFNRRLAVRQDFEKEEMRRQHQAYLDAESERLRRFKERLVDKEAKLRQEGKLTEQAQAEIDKEKEAAEKEHLNKIEEANASHNELMALKEKEWAQQRAEEREKQAESDRNRRNNEAIAAIEFWKKTKMEEVEAERDAMNAKMNIQKEYLAFTQSMFKLIGKASKDSGEIQKALFFLQKGAAIAGVIVNANQALANQAANAATAHIANFTAYLQAGAQGGPFAQAAAVAPYLANKAKINAEQAVQGTITKVSAATAIANILATMIGSGTTVSGGSGGAGGGGATVEAGFNPNFNVIGSTGENQLASAIAQQTGDVRAFILWDDLQEGQGIYNNTVEDSLT